MKVSYTLVASILAASTVALSFPSSDERLTSSREKNRSDSNSYSSKEKFAPRFDGLRFIETLVTAHR